MRTKTVKENKNLQVPGEPLSEKELVKLIKDAEKAPMMTVQEGMNDFESWLKTKEKKKSALIKFTLKINKFTCKVN